jgi:hypothetical protein
MKKTQAKRGTLKANVSTSEPVVDSSGDFSIFVIIENPYDVPITLYSVQTHIPVQLIDSIWYQRFEESQIVQWSNEANKQKGWRKTLLLIKNWFKTIGIKMAKPNSPRIAEAVGTETKEVFQHKQTETSLGVTVEGNANEGNFIAGSFNEVWRLKFPKNPTNEELDRIFMKIEDFKGAKRPVVLQPGNAVVKQFVLRAKEKVFFRPIAYKFQIQIRYAVDGQENLDTVSYNLQIRATIISIMTGSVFGSILGAISRSFGQVGGGLSISVFVLSAIFGAIAIIAFARKENAQTIISIEDFWGGVLVGFLIGYLGEEYFKSIVGI